MVLSSSTTHCAPLLSRQILLIPGPTSASSASSRGGTLLLDALFRTKDGPLWLRSPATLGASPFLPRLAILLSWLGLPLLLLLLLLLLPVASSSRRFLATFGARDARCILDLLMQARPFAFAPRRPAAASFSSAASPLTAATTADHSMIIHVLRRHLRWCGGAFEPHVAGDATYAAKGGSSACRW